MVAQKTKLLKKNLPFIEKYVEKNLVTNEILKIVFPHTVHFGITGSSKSVTVFGNLLVCGSFVGGSGEANLGANVGSATGEVFRDKTDVTLNFKTFVGGTDISITNGADTITIDSTATGEANVGANVGGGTGNVFRDKTDVTLNFKTLVGGTAVDLTDNADTITIDSTAASTLDEAYDGGASGAGRLVTVDAGAIQLQGAIGSHTLELTGTQDMTGTIFVDGGVGRALQATGSIAATQMFTSDITVGDGTGSPFLVFDKSGGGTTSIGFQVASVNRWVNQVDSIENLFWLRFDGGGAFIDAPLTMEVVTGDLRMTNNVNIGADLSLTSSNPTLTLGDALGNPVIVLDKNTAGNGDIRFDEGGLTDWRIRHDTNEDLLIVREGVDTPLTVELSTGDLRMTNNVNIGTNLSLTSSSPIITVGDGTGNPTIILNKDELGTGVIAYQSESNTLWVEGAETDESWKLKRYNDGIFQDDTIRVDNATGDTVFVNDINMASAAAFLLIGDGTGQPTLRLNKGDANGAVLDFFNAGVIRWRFQHTSTEDFQLVRFDSGGTFIDSLLTFVATTGEFRVANDLSLTSSSPSLTVGDGTGTPNVTLNKLDGGAALLDFRNAGILRWRVNMEGDEDFAIQRFDASEVFQDKPFEIVQSTGDIELANNLSLTSSNPTLTVGDGGGSPTVLIDKADMGVGEIKWSNAGTQRWVLRAGATEDFELLRFGSGGGFAENAFAISQNDSTVRLGRNLALTSSSPTLTVGDGTGSPIINLDKSNAGTSEMRWQSGSLTRFSNRLDSSENLIWRRHDDAGVGVDTAITIDGGTSDVTFANDITMASSSPLLTVGNAAGSSASPNILINKGSAGSGLIDWQVDSVLRWRMIHTSDEDFKIDRFDDGGSFIDAPLLIASGSGNVFITNDLFVTGTVSGSVGLFGGLANGQHSIAISVGTHNAVVTERVIRVNSSISPVTVQLPAATEGGEWHIVVTAGSGGVTLAPNGSDNLNGANSTDTISTVGRYIVSQDGVSDNYAHGPIANTT